MWFKVDDHFHEHRKVRRLRADALLAVGLWTLCGSWSGLHEQEGFVPVEVAHKFGQSRTIRRAVNALVDAELWSEVERNGEKGWQFHDWDDYQPTIEEIVRLRTSRAEAGRKGGVRSGQVRRSNREASASSNGEASVKQNEANTNPDPTRPDPTPTTDTPSGVSPAARKRAPRATATRIPEPFEVTEEMRAWGREKCPHVHGAQETEKFVDYWRAKAGRDATKHDWTGTWRNWMRKAEERALERPTAGVVPFRSAGRPNADDKIAVLQAMKGGGHLPGSPLSPASQPRAIGGGA